MTGAELYSSLVFLFVIMGAGLLIGLAFIISEIREKRRKKKSLERLENIKRVWKKWRDERFEKDINTETPDVQKQDEC